VAEGPAPTNELDRKIEDLLLFLVSVQRQRHERWRTRLVEVLGWRSGGGPGSPADVRRKIERRLFAFGATKAARTYPRPTKIDGMLEEIQTAVGDILAGLDPDAVTRPEPIPQGGIGEESRGEATRSQEA